MARIYRYLKITDSFTTYCLVEPAYDLKSEERITELCDIDGATYVSVPDSVALPAQPEELGVEAVALDESLREAISAASPYIKLINSRVVDRIREKHSVNDEIKMLRIGPSPETEAYNNHVEACRAWGKAEKERLLGPPVKAAVESWLSSKEALTERLGGAAIK